MAIYSRLMLGTAFTINAGNIERGNLFSTELTIFNINPTVIGKASAWSAGFLSQSVAAPAGTLSIPTATQYTRAQWEAAGWTYATLEFDIDAFVKANVVNIYGSVITDVISVTSKFSVGGTEYAIAFTYPGNVGTILAPTTPIGVSWTVGLNQFGSIGDNTIINRSSPVQVIGNHSFASVATGNSRALGLKTNGEVWAWGFNASGQIGDNTAINRSSPVQVIGNHSFVSVGSNGGVAIATKADGTTWAWGSNAQGSVGDGTIANRSSPVLVLGNHSFIQVMGNHLQSGALKADGSVWMWGQNPQGQLGRGNLVSTSSPVQVIGNHSFASFSVSDNHTLALKADGSVWSWGFNLNLGVLGDNANANRSSPVLVVGNHSFKTVKNGVQVSAGLKADGSVWCWGSNNSGQNGDGTIVARSSPVQVIGNHSFVQIAAAGFAIAARKANGEIWAWGENTQGGLGDGTITNKSSPVLVIGNHSFKNLTAERHFILGIK